MKTCEFCQKPIYRDLKTITFASGNSPICSIELMLAVEWCPTPNCYHHVEQYNALNQRNDAFVDAVVLVRDMIRPIAEGKIRRGCRVSQYDAEPGDRKITLKDARPIAQRAIDRLNEAINKFTEHVMSHER